MAILPVWLTLRHLHDHWSSLMMDSCYFEAQPDTWSLRIKNAIEVLRRTAIALWCDYRGHDFIAETAGLEESGGEELICQRCGYSRTCWHN